MSALPAGPFGCILADPPWRFATFSAKGRGRSPDGPAPDYHISAGGYGRSSKTVNSPERHYATMTMDSLKALPVADVAAKDCILFMWAVDPMLPQALELGASWGFTYKTVGFYWAKLRRRGSSRHLLHNEADHKLFPMGTGYWTRANPEPCLLFTRGHPRRLSQSVRKLIIAHRREHSVKPEEQYGRIEALCSGPRLEMFARSRRDNWTSWGNEVGVRDGSLFEERCTPVSPSTGEA